MCLIVVVPRIQHSTLRPRRGWWVTDSGPLILAAMSLQSPSPITNLDLLDVVVEDTSMADVNDINAIEVKVWFSKYSIVVKWKNDLNEAINKAYAVVIKLCSSPWLITRLEGADRYVQGICYRFNGQGQGVFTLIQAKKHVYLFIKDLNMSTDKYLLQFKALMSMMGTYGGSFAEPALIKAEFVTAGVMAYSRWHRR